MFRPHDSWGAPGCWDRCKLRPQQPAQTFFTEPPLPQELLLPSPGFEPSLGKGQPHTRLPKGVRKRRSTHQTVVTPCTSVGDQPHGSADHQPVVLRRPTRSEEHTSELQSRFELV